MQTEFEAKGPLCICNATACSQQDYQRNKSTNYAPNLNAAKHVKVLKWHSKSNARSDVGNAKTTKMFKGCGPEHADLNLESEARPILRQSVIMTCGLNARESQ